MTNEIEKYLIDKYHPHAVLVYGSYNRGDYDEYSDYDCIIIVDSKEYRHDDTVIGGVMLDCFIFTVEEARYGDPELFIPLYSSRILFDDGVGLELKKRVSEYMESQLISHNNDKEFIRSWIRKTLLRMKKNDDDGNYRAVMLLQESLEDYYLLRDMLYAGSRSAIKYLRENDDRGYILFKEAVTIRDNVSISEWAEHVIR